MAYSWIPFYKELSQKLLQFRSNRKPLVDWIYDNIDGINKDIVPVRYRNIESLKEIKSKIARGQASTIEEAIGKK